MVLVRVRSSLSGKNHTTNSTNQQQRRQLSMPQEQITAAAAAAIAAADFNFDGRAELIQDRSYTISRKRYEGSWIGLKSDWPSGFSTTTTTTPGRKTARGTFDGPMSTCTSKQTSLLGSFSRKWLDVQSWSFRILLTDCQETSVSTEGFVVDYSRLVQPS